MSKWQTPITDRDALDILNRTAKAFINISDWLRIYWNTQQVRDMASVLLIDDFEITELDAPAITDFPKVEDINTLIANIDLLREAVQFPTITGLVALKHDYQAGSGAVAPNYERVNEWEQDLLLLRDLLVAMAGYLVFCGVAAVGQARHWQHRYRQWPYYVPAAATPVRRPRTGLAGSGAGLDRNNYFRRYD